MKRLNQIAVALIFLAFMMAGCQKNYYTSKAKNNDCGCPNKKGMVGY